MKIEELAEYGYDLQDVEWDDETESLEKSQREYDLSQKQAIVERMFGQFLRDHVDDLSAGTTHSYDMTITADADRLVVEFQSDTTELTVIE